MTLLITFGIAVAITAAVIFANTCVFGTHTPPNGPNGEYIDQD